MNKSNVGKPITTHEHLEKITRAKKWIVISKRVKGKMNYTHQVAAYFVNSRYLKLCDMLRQGMLFEYKKNK